MQPLLVNERKLQRRSAVRCRLQLPVIFYWNHGGEYTAGGFTCDVAVDGALIQSATCPPIGCDVRIEVLIPSPDMSREQLRIQCLGKVTRCTSQSGGNAFGVRGFFDDDHIRRQCVDNRMNPLETAGYLECGEAHIYSVLHHVPNPLARVLLVGPFASERYASYISWVRWARFMAARRIEVLRFDYRGVGESTGSFEQMGFATWTEDVEFLCRWLKGRTPTVPLILHGLELGALLARKAFSGGIGDALLLWSSPKNANEVLRRPLSRRAFMSFSERRPLSYYVRTLEEDQSLEVDGYLWSGRLWRESFTFDSLSDSRNAEVAPSYGGRPVNLVKLEGSQASVLRGSSLGRYVFVNPDLSDLFGSSFQWIAEALGLENGSSNESGH